MAVGDGVDGARLARIRTAGEGDFRAVVGRELRGRGSAHQESGIGESAHCARSGAVKLLRTVVYNLAAARKSIRMRKSYNVEEKDGRWRMGCGVGDLVCDRACRDSV
jgi:hypothetical protein